MKNRETLILQWLITLIPVVYYLSLWKLLPDEVPTHYNFNLKPDDFQSKEFMLGILIFMGLVVVGSSAAILNGNSIDPKRKTAQSDSILKITTWLVTVFITLIMFMIVIMTKNYCIKQPIESFEKIIFIVLCLFFICLGFLMKNAKPNYFFGIRTPWTLASEENWKQTHLFGSKIWIYGNILLGTIILISPNNLFAPIFIIGIIILSSIPVYYSYRLYSKE
ncbi:MAG: SdpI family protein [Bacteroidota bacterium]|jgi:uncharacterized membrane protein